MVCSIVSDGEAPPQGPDHYICMPLSIEKANFLHKANGTFQIFFNHNFLVNFNAKWSQGVKKEFFLFIHYRYNGSTDLSDFLTYLGVSAAPSVCWK